MQRQLEVDVFEQFFEASRQELQSLAGDVASHDSLGIRA
jgi:hypothetical protein